MFTSATLVSAEGGDRVGKATQTKLLVEKLSSLGFKVVRVEVPIKSAVTYKIIYRMLKDGSAKRCPTIFQFVQFFNKIFWQLFTLTFLRLRYDFIVFDRWALSGLVYGSVTGVPHWLNSLMFKLLTKPDITIVIHGSSLERKEEPDSYERDDLFQAKVRAEYVRRAAEMPRTELVVRKQTREEVHAQIMKTLHGVV